MAHIKAGGVTRGPKNNFAKRRGVKLYAGQKVKPGGIIVRQKGTKVHPGENVKMGKDFTIFAVKEGIVEFADKHSAKFVNVI
ncbi:MAG: 50S ribosomal protein L27 [bacterium]|nr:50S ribosomal protein L27 [bacterium]